MATVSESSEGLSQLCLLKVMLLLTTWTAPSYYLAKFSYEHYFQGKDIKVFNSMNFESVVLQDYRFPDSVAEAVIVTSVVDQT